MDIEIFEWTFSLEAASAQTPYREALSAVYRPYLPLYDSQVAFFSTRNHFGCMRDFPTTSGGAGVFDVILFFPAGFQFSPFVSIYWRRLLLDSSQRKSGVLVFAFPQLRLRRPGIDLTPFPHIHTVAGTHVNGRS